MCVCLRPCYVFPRAGSISPLPISIFADISGPKISRISISIFFSAALFGLRSAYTTRCWQDWKVSDVFRFCLCRPNDIYAVAGTLKLSRGYFCHFRVTYCVKLNRQLSVWTMTDVTLCHIAKMWVSLGCTRIIVLCFFVRQSEKLY